MINHIGTIVDVATSRRTLTREVLDATHLNGDQARRDSNPFESLAFTFKDTCPDSDFNKFCVNPCVAYTSDGRVKLPLENLHPPFATTFPRVL